MGFASYYHFALARFRVWTREAQLTFRALVANRISVAGLIVIVIVALSALLASVLASEHPDYALVGAMSQERWAIDLGSTLQSPGFGHPFGTDELGRDIFSRVLYGGRLDLILPLEVILFSALIGVVIGGIGGYFERFIGEALMRFTDVFLAVPSIILALSLVAALGASLNHVVLAMIATWWAWYARLIYGETRRMKHRDFVDVARSSGLGGTAVFFKHVLPNVFAPVVVQATSDMGTAILAIAGLSFLGLGASPGTAEWGLMISESQNYIFGAWWYPVFPGIAIIVTVMAFNLLGDGLRDVLDPTARRWQSRAAREKTQVVEAKKAIQGVSRIVGLLLGVRNLSINYHTFEGTVQAAREVSFNIHEKEAYGIIGESGCGKSTVAWEIVGLLPRPPGEAISGNIILRTHRTSASDCVDLRELSVQEMNRIRGNRIAIIFQDVLDSLHPSYRISFQMSQTYLLHQFDTLLQIATNEVRGAYQERNCPACGSKVESGSWICGGCFSMVDPSPDRRRTMDEGPEESLSYSQRREISKYRELYKRYGETGLGPDRPPSRRVGSICRKLVARDLRKVMVPAPERTIDLYPFELSGGMRQRVVIAMMMACNPQLLIADEPTTALDVVSERNILDLLKEFKESLGISILLISHDLNVIRRFCDRVGVMYAGRIVEEGSLDQVFRHPVHPYTEGLMQSRPLIYENGEFATRGNLYVIPGVVPDLKNPPPGCLFADRCARASPICRQTVPEPVAVDQNHFVACHNYRGGPGS